MLIQITNNCLEQCEHCFQDSKPESCGEMHMSKVTFIKSVAFAKLKLMQKFSQYLVENQQEILFGMNSLSILISRLRFRLHWLLTERGSKTKTFVRR